MCVGLVLRTFLMYCIKCAFQGDKCWEKYCEWGPGLLWSHAGEEEAHRILHTLQTIQEEILSA